MKIFAALFGIFVFFAMFLLWLEVEREQRRQVPPPPVRALPPLTSAARMVLPYMVQGKIISARTIAGATLLPVAGVLAAQRELRGIGLAIYARAANDNGRLSGSGYSLTDAGIEARDRLAEAA